MACKLVGRLKGEPEFQANDGCGGLTFKEPLFLRVEEGVRCLFDQETTWVPRRPAALDRRPAECGDDGGGGCGRTAAWMETWWFGGSKSKVFGVLVFFVGLYFYSVFWCVFSGFNQTATFFQRRPPWFCPLGPNDPSHSPDKRNRRGEASGPCASALCARAQHCAWRLLPLQPGGSLRTWSL